MDDTLLKLLIDEIKGLRRDVKEINVRLSDGSLRMQAIEQSMASRPCEQHADRMIRLGSRVSKLEKDKRRAMIGWGVFSLGVAAGGRLVWEWVARKMP